MTSRICARRVFKNLTIFTDKKPVLEPPFNKVGGLKACRFIKKRLEHRCFPVNIAKFQGQFFYRTPLVAASVS